MLLIDQSNKFLLHLVKASICAWQRKAWKARPSERWSKSQLNKHKVAMG